ncbi:MAG: HAD-IA family hydrolase [Candidatus Methanomethylophilaceae archaeon]|nr:HAD-IA family hydrolase [Candidatus Methanomethylophilaceae archaeon]
MENRTLRQYIGSETIPDYVSFDVFDTLILRPFLRPTDLFRYMEDCGAAPEGFAAERIEAERTARRIKKAEVTLDEIYSYLGPGMQVSGREIETEKALCVANPETAAMVSEAIEAGKKVIIATDVYLPRETVEYILEASGIRYHHLFVSSEEGVTKHSGEMFRRITDRLNIRPEDMVHIGDSARSDVEMASRSGVRGIKYVRQDEKYFKENPWAKRFASEKSLEHSVIAGIDILYSCGALGESGGEHYDLGFRFGGPLITAYSDYIRRAAAGDSPLVFVARDGYNLIRVYPVLFGSGRKMQYINAQRLFAYVLTDRYIPFGKMDLPKKSTRRFEHGKVVAHLVYLLDFFREDLGIECVPEDPYEMLDLYNRNSDLIDSLRRERSGDYRNYIKSVFGGEEAELVDCTTMKYTSQILVEEMLGRKVRGHYFITLADSGLDYDAFHRREHYSFGWVRINVPEFFMSSPELPVSGWKDGSPVYMRDVPEWEKNRCSFYGRITAGECGYAEVMRSLFGDKLPKLGYSSVAGWSLLSALKESKYRHILDGVKWASGPDHSDWSSLVPVLGDVPFLLKKTASDFISKMNHRSLAARLGINSSRAVIIKSEPDGYRGVIQTGKKSLEPAFETHLHPFGSFQHFQISAAFDVAAEMLVVHMSGRSYAQESESFFQEFGVVEFFDVFLEIIVSGYLHPPSVVALAVAGGLRPDYVFVHGFGVIAHFFRMKKDFVREIDVLAQPLRETDSVLFYHFPVVKHGP